MHLLRLPNLQLRIIERWRWALKKRLQHASTSENQDYFAAAEVFEELLARGWFGTAAVVCKEGVRAKLHRKPQGSLRGLFFTVGAPGNGEHIIVQPVGTPAHSADLIEKAARIVTRYRP